MNRSQRVVALVGLVVVLVALGRSLMPFSTGAYRARRPCGIVLTEATRGPKTTGVDMVLSAKGVADKAAAQAAVDSANRARYPARPAGGFGVFDLRAYEPGAAVVADDATFDHVTVTHFALSPCVSSARRRLVGDVVLAAMALVGTAGGLLIARGPRLKTANSS